MLHYIILKEWLLARSTHSTERGSVTEEVIITAILAGLALAAGAIIVAKVVGKAEAISLD